MGTNSPQRTHEVLIIELVLGEVYCGWSESGFNNGHCQSFDQHCFTSLFKLISVYI